MDIGYFKHAWTTFISVICTNRFWIVDCLSKLDGWCAQYLASFLWFVQSQHLSGPHHGSCTCNFLFYTRFFDYENNLRLNLIRRNLWQAYILASVMVNLTSSLKIWAFQSPRNAKCARKFRRNPFFHQLLPRMIWRAQRFRWCIATHFSVKHERTCGASSGTRGLSALDLRYERYFIGIQIAFSHVRFALTLEKSFHMQC